MNRRSTYLSLLALALLFAPTLHAQTQVTAWGSNFSGQTDVPAGLTDVTAVAAGGNHTVALKDDGTVVAWGENLWGQTDVPAGLMGVTAIAAGFDHTVAVKDGGTVVAWGRNQYGLTSVPAGLTGVTAVAAAQFHTVALKADGTVVAWGENYDGQTSVPVGLTDVTAVAAGSSHTVALKDDGTVVAWGYNGNGQTSVPAGLTGVTAIAAVHAHTVAVSSLTEPPVACAAGSFSATGSEPCTPASPGFFVATAGATQATACLLGTYQPNAGQTACLVAGIGFYVDLARATAPTACPSGQTTTGVGSTSVTDCFTPNRPPVANAGPDQTAVLGQTITLDGTGSSDPDGDALTYAWTLTDPVGAAVALSDDTAAMPTFVTALRGTYTGTLTVNDGTVNSASAEVVRVEVVNRPPVADAGLPQTVIAGQTVTLNGSGSDPDGDALTYAWTLTGPGYADAALTGAVPTFCAAEATAPGNLYTASLVVNDGSANSVNEATVEVTALSASAALGVLIADVEALGPEGDPLNDGQVNGLTRKLVQAQRKLARGQDPAEQLAGFRQQVLDLWQIDGVLDEDQAEALLASVDAIGRAVASPCTPGETSNDTAARSATAKASDGDDAASRGEGGVPAAFALEAPYPNPFRSSATLTLAVPESSLARVVVYDALGRTAAVLLDGPVEAGRRPMRFDASGLPSGTYLVRLTTEDGFTQTRRLTLLR